MEANDTVPNLKKYFGRLNYIFTNILTQSRYAPNSYLDEGVYVNTNGELVRHAVLQWGETPYAIGKFYLLCRYEFP